MIHSFVHCVGAGAHDHDYSFGLGMSRVIEKLIMAPRQFGESVHETFHDFRACVIKGVRGLASLEKHIGVLSSPAEHRLIRSESALAMGLNGLLGDQAAQVIIT